MDAINVLWTGGWDSTYRVLDLLLIENQRVRPYYIVDPDRLSIANEIIAMTRIQHHIQISFPARAPGLLPVEFVHLESIRADEEISRWHQRLATRVHIGTQYDWLARFAKHHVTEPELCIEHITMGDTELFRNFVRPVLRGEGHACRAEGPFPEPGIQMFTYFRFPIIHLKKAEMRKLSEKHGFSDILELTWFCHTPRKGLPCGKCRPCLLASESGFHYTVYQSSAWDMINSLRTRFDSFLLK